MRKWYERFRWRLHMLRLGWTLMPMAGADGAGDGGGDGGDGGAGDGGDGGAAPAGKQSGGQEPAGGDSGDGGDEPLDLDRAKEKIHKANSEAANLRKRLKDLEPLAKKARELEEASKTTEQKLEERATGAETRATKAEAEAARLRVALRKGLSETQAKRLVGESEEDLEKDADELLESFKGDGGQEPPARPRERLRPGAAPAADAADNDPAKLAEQVPRGW